VPKPAKLCSPEEIKLEVWEQLKAGLNSADRLVLQDSNLWGWHLDDDLIYEQTLPPKNTNPLLVHPPGSWHLRPEAATAIPNLVLASDYVRTYTNLASMEGANEAARRAINIILERDRYGGSLAEVWQLEEPAMFNFAKQVDRILLSRGRKHIFQLAGVNNLFAAIALLRKLNQLTGLSAKADSFNPFKLQPLLEWLMRLPPQSGTKRNATPFSLF
jgi:hypothetical protein